MYMRTGICNNFNIIFEKSFENIQIGFLHTVILYSKCNWLFITVSKGYDNMSQKLA